MSSTARLVVIRNCLALAVLFLWLVQYFGVRHAAVAAALWISFICGVLVQVVLLVRTAIRE